MLKNYVSVELQGKIMEIYLEWIPFEHCPYSAYTIYALLCSVYGLWFWNQVTGLAVSYPALFVADHILYARKQQTK